MATNGVRHQDDGGNVTIFGSAKQMLFACDKGHWWVVNASSSGSNLDDSKPTQAAVARLRENFGAESVRMLKLD